MRCDEHGDGANDADLLQASIRPLDDAGHLRLFEQNNE
jgi:hypothetical protein